MIGKVFCSKRTEIKKYLLIVGQQDEKFSCVLGEENKQEYSDEYGISCLIGEVCIVFSCHESRMLAQDELGKEFGKVDMLTLENVLRKLIEYQTKLFFEAIHKPSLEKVFVAGQDRIAVSGKVYDEKEMIELVNSSLDFTLTADKYNSEFEKRLADYLGAKYTLTTNSGSSANLLAISALTSYKLGKRALQPGDEVICVACGFPTTVNPILQHGLIPVFVDVDLPTYNVQAEQIEPAITKRTRAIILAHTLGNPFNLEEVMRVATKYDLWVIEDCCDALGARYTLAGKTKHVGTFGHIGTLSFYPAHHITMGEGGAVFSSDKKLMQIIRSFRDWGRDCWCAPGCNNTCSKRFDWQMGDLPQGYDHKYIYSHAGYNLKITDMQAAVSLVQMDKLDTFIKKRNDNFLKIKAGLTALEKFLLLPKTIENSKPSWFGFPITLTDACKFPRTELLKYLNERKIDTRLLFAGNLLKQPYFNNKHYKVFGKLENTDLIMERTFWIGVFPGLSEEQIEFMLQSFYDFFKKTYLA